MGKLFFDQEFFVRYFIFSIFNLFMVGNIDLRVEMNIN